MLLTHEAQLLYLSDHGIGGGRHAEARAWCIVSFDRRVQNNATSNVEKNACTSLTWALASWPLC
jgi:hypothetical protein